MRIEIYIGEKKIDALKRRVEKIWIGTKKTGKGKEREVIFK